MATRNYNTLGVYVFISAFVAQVMFFVFLYPRIDDPSVLTSWVTSAAIPMLGWLYHLLRKHSVRFFILTARVRSFFNDQSPTWQLSGTWQGEKLTLNTYTQLIDALRTSRGDDVRVTVTRINNESHIVYFSPGPTVEMSYTRHLSNMTGDTDEPYLHIKIRNYRVSFRKAAKVIGSEVMPVIEKINKVTGISAKYSFNIMFDKSQNPFFGFYLSQLPKEVVSSFVIQLDLPDSHAPNKVRISEDRVAVNTRSEVSLQNLAVQLLSLDYDLSRRL